MENIPIYSTSTPQTIEAFRNRPCSLPKNNAKFSPPTPEEIKILRNLMGLSQKGLAKLVGVSYTNDKGSPTIRKWETLEQSKEHRPINYAAWRLMLVGANVINTDTIINEIAEYRF